MDMAITAYINRVDGCPCGDTKISLFKGAGSQEFQAKQNSFFLKDLRSRNKYCNGRTRTCIPTLKTYGKSAIAT
jgi:hypothetical protein